MKTLLEQANAMADELIAIRRHLHQNAEPGFALTKTKEFVKTKLIELGYTPVECGKCGLYADIGSGDSTFLLRADMDALPMKEESGVDFACETGAMHACGHDMHTTMLLGAAKLLKDNEDSLHGRVRLMFQPSEETFEGAKDMIEAGVLENPRPDAALMLHVVAGMPIPTGMVMYAPGKSSAAAADYFTIEVTGRGCHGSMPHQGVDAINAAAHILIALQELTARELAVEDEAILTIGSFHAGDAPNAIAGSATMKGTLRTYDEKVRAMLKDRISEMAPAIASAFRAEAMVIYTSCCPTLVNDPALGEFVEKNVRELLGADHFMQVGRGSGSEDFAYVSHEVPSVMLSVGAGNPESGYAYPQHHPQASFDESILPIGAALLAYNAIKWGEK